MTDSLLYSNINKNFFQFKFSAKNIFFRSASVFCRKPAAPACLLAGGQAEILPVFLATARPFPYNGTIGNAPERASSAKNSGTGRVSGRQGHSL
ncbi:hypothetical protein [Allofournierella sp.]|uniref:hypothetical protein n=1 Tax=Allofournierella sp. TaxID=1940256 RepID=UPI003AEF532B